MLFGKKKIKEFYKKMISYRNENNLYDELTNDDCEFYASVLNVIHKATNSQYTVDEVFNIYDFFTDVADE